MNFDHVENMARMERQHDAANETARNVTPDVLERLVRAGLDFGPEPLSERGRDVLRDAYAALATLREQLEVAQGALRLIRRGHPDLVRAALDRSVKEER